MFISHSLQLGFGIVLAIIVVFLVLHGDEKKVFALLIMLMPFQPIESTYGSLNFALTIGFFVALWTKKKIKGQSFSQVDFGSKFAFVLILIAYFASLVSSPRALWKDGFFFILNFAGNFLLIVIALQMIRNEFDIHRVFFWMAISSILVFLYTVIQINLGEQTSGFFGVSEFKLVDPLHAGRTYGPFKAQSAFAGFLVIMSIISSYCFLSNAETRRMKWFWAFIYLINVGLLISTGSRMGFITYCLSVVGLLGIFIQKKGVIKSIGFVIFIIISASIAGHFVLKYTEYNSIFDRLVGTKIYGIEIDSRRGLLPYYVDKIAEKPIFGHRPNQRLPKNYKPSELVTQPHNFYIYVLFTVGLFGLFCYLLFFFFIFRNLLKAVFLWKNRSVEFKELPLVCLLIFVIFLIQQFSVGFINYNLRDYQQIIFLLIGLFCALPKIARYRNSGN